MTLTDFTKWLQANKLTVIKSMITGIPTLKYIGKQYGVKVSAPLMKIKTAPILEDGKKNNKDITFGTANLIQKQIDTVPLKSVVEYAQNELLDSILAKEMTQVAGKEKLPLSQLFMEDFVQELNDMNENLIWQGNTEGTFTGTDIYLKRYDGFLKKLTADTDVIDATAGADITTALKNVINAVPIGIRNKVDIYMGTEQFDAYVATFVDKNLFHYAPEVDDNMTIVVPGRRIKVHGVTGLDTTNKIIASVPANLVYGTDVNNASEIVKFWLSEDDDMHYGMIKYNAGVQYGYGKEIVMGSVTV